MSLSKSQGVLNSVVTCIRFDPDLHEETLLFSNGLAIRASHNHPADEWYILTPEEECVVGGDRVWVTEKTNLFVTPMGFEPMIFGMKTRRPRPLDDGACGEQGCIIANSYLLGELS